MSTGELTGIVLTVERYPTNDGGSQARIVAQTSDSDGYAVAQASLVWSLNGPGALDPPASITDSRGQANTFIKTERGMAKRSVLRCVDPETGVETHAAIGWN